jgi:DHA3 family macrolide efflux protein-like MFS transporter
MNDTPSSDPRWKGRFAAFISSQTLSLLGSSLVQYAIMWYITLKTDSGAMMTLSIAFAFVPHFLMSPFAGVWADRHDRKRLIALSDGAVALVALGLAAAFALGYGSAWLLLAAQALRSVGGAIQQPAVGALLQQIVPRESLARANGINGAIQSAVMLFSPMAAGALMSIAPLELLFGIDVLTAALAIATLLAFLRVAPHAKAAERASVGYFRDMREGLRYVREHRYLVPFFAFLAAVFFLVTPAAFLTPLQASRAFGREVWRLTAIEIAFSGGMLAGGAIVAIRSGFRNRMRTMVAAAAFFGLCTVALALVPEFTAYLGIMVLFGVTMPYWNTASATMLQEHVEPDYMGRVFSVLSMISTSVMPIAMLAFGPLADVISLEWILVATGGALCAVSFAPLASRRLMAAGIPPTD